MSARFASCFLILLLGHAPAEGLQQEPAKEESSPGKDKRVLTRFADGSSLKLVILEKQIVLNTEFGRLVIPTAAIEQIDFGLRLSAEARQEIDKQIEKLNSEDIKEREAAEARLLALGEKAYPAVLRLSKKENIAVETLQHVQNILTKLEDTLSEEQRKIPEMDIVQTAHSRLAGKIEMEAFAAQTTQFGDVKMRIGDLRQVVFSSREPEIDPSLITDGPTNLTALGNQIGQTFYFRVTGQNQGALYGTGTYTADSYLAMAAVHSGALKLGQTGVVKVTIVPPPASYTSSSQHGITSNMYGFYGAAYRVEKVRR